MLEVVLAVLLGAAIGVVCGLLPGLHVNSTIPLLLGLSFLFSPLSTSIALITAGIVQSFVCFIPSIFLGAPEGDSALAVLPGHKLLLEGRGYEAVKLTVIGGFGAVLVTICTLPVFALFIPPLYHFIRPNIHFILIFVVCYMILRENGTRKKFLSLSVFLLAGLLGVVVLNASDLLFPLLSGLFGLPLLLVSLKDKTKIPEKVSFDELKLKGRGVLAGIVTGSFAGILAGLLPGIGSAQATVLAQEVMPKENEETGMRKFLIAIGGVNTADIIYSLLAIWLISNPRSGVAVAVDKLLTVGLEQILIFIPVILIAASIGMCVTLKISKRAIFLLRRINYQKLCLFVFCFVFGLVGIFSGAIGLVIAGVALAVGLIPNLLGIRRSYAMGVLLCPTILFFAGL